MISKLWPIHQFNNMLAVDVCIRSIDHPILEAEEAIDGASGWVVEKMSKISLRFVDIELFFKLLL